MSVCFSPKALHLCPKYKLKRIVVLKDIFSRVPVLDNLSRRYAEACPRGPPKTAHPFLHDCVEVSGWITVFPDEMDTPSLFLSSSSID